MTEYRMRHSRVLIIDDSLTIRAMMEELLMRLGDRVTIAMASDGAAAGILIRDFRPTLITLDLNMPGINGLAFLDELGAYPHAPVVVVSSMTTDDSAASKDAIAHGADACFDKAKIVSETPRFLRLLAKVAARKLRTPISEIVKA